MGIIDPMAVTNAAATGVLDFGGAHTIWLAVMAVMVGAGIAIALSAVNQIGASLPALPWLRHSAALAARAAK